MGYGNGVLCGEISVVVLVLLPIGPSPMVRWISDKLDDDDDDDDDDSDDANHSFRIECTGTMVEIVCVVVLVVHSTFSSSSSLR